ncbi:MAG: hypothetical protein AB1458_16660 [Bacteroidota bacterium]
MSTNLKKGLFYSAIALYLLLLGFLREHIFVNINYQLYKLYYDDDLDYRLPADLQFLENYSYMELYYGKWALTGLFCLLFFLPAWLIVKKVFRERIFLRLTLIAHLSVLLIAGIFYALAVLLDDYDKWYGLSRTFMGYLQSPWMMLVLIPAFLIMQPSKQKADKMHSE